MKSHEIDNNSQSAIANSQFKGWRLWLLGFLFSIPVVVFAAAGILWLYDRGWLSWAGLGFLAVQALALILFRRWSQVPGAVLPQPSSTLPADLAPRDEAAWKLVQEYIEQIDRGELTLKETDQFWSLGREILTRIAQCYHPNDKEPLLAVQVPLLFRALEETARDLATITAEVPLAHRITIGDAVRGYRLQQKVKPAYDVYRVLYPILNWQNALFQWFVTDRLFDLTKETLRQWILKWYVDRVGYHAIELYSGKLLVTRRLEGRLPLSPDSATLLTADQHSSEPLRILVLGQAKAGKSSLVNALFGELRVATDVVPTTAQVTPYVLDRHELGGKVIMSDMGGYEDATVPQARFDESLEEVQRSDVLLLVLSAVSAARDADRRLLSLIDRHFAVHPELRPPFVLAVLSHTDLLRPVREWDPPYNVAVPDAAKAHTIRAAMTAVAADLALDPELVVPVCLLPDRVYNVDEALVPLLVEILPEAKRTLLLRSLKTLRQQEQWSLLGRQARATGRFLWQLGEEVLKKYVRV
ncbi:MAG: hypothetical protein FJ147_03110 [Deltaproteobacteria bacterium]|nr:hypothetical protein [Deltaproteobacteria bacterium]